MSSNALTSLPWLFEHWALDHQLPPEGDWTTWVILGGRGAGKTRAGAEWVRAQVEGGKPGDPGRCSRVALVGETLDEAREVMVFGASGILACSPPDRRPEWQGSRKRLVWPNGATAQTFSASDPESLRGPQFDAAWCDEVGKWLKPATWDQLQFALRLGDRPRKVVTTTPRTTGLLQGILEAPTTAVTRAPTAANRMHLAAGFVEAIEAQYAGTRLGRQEIEGEIVPDNEGALWTWEMLEAARGLPERELDQIVVAVDPAVTSGAESDECGIVVAGVNRTGPPLQWTAEVIADGSLKAAAPQAWAERAIELFHRYGAHRILVEVNQGGQLITDLLRTVDGHVPITALRARVGKGERAAPVAALYEQGRVRHRRAFAALEAQMTEMTLRGFVGRGSPDRVDALVHAISALLVEPARSAANPQVRRL